MTWLKKFLAKFKYVFWLILVVSVSIFLGLGMEREIKKNFEFRISNFETEEKKNIGENKNTVKVVGVMDGDTIRIETKEGEIELVRLLGVDAEEMNSKLGTKSNCLANQAKDKIEELTLGKNAVLEGDELNEDKDKYGRILRYVIVDGKNINLEIVRLGYAKFYWQYPVSKKEEFIEAEKIGSSVSICNN